MGNDIVEKWKKSKKLKKSDIDATIAKIKKQTEKGIDKESQEYKRLQEMLDIKQEELENTQSNLLDIQEELKYETAGTDKYAAMLKARDCALQTENRLIEEILQLEARIAPPKPGTEEFAKLRKDLEQELKNKKLVKEMRMMGLSADKILMVAVILLIAGFGFALDLESPKALKIASFALKLPMCKV